MLDINNFRVHDRTYSERGLYNIQVKRADIFTVIRGFPEVALGNPRTLWMCVKVVCWAYRWL